MLKLFVLALLAMAVTAQDLAAQKAHVMCVIETQLSSDACKRTAKAQVNADTDVASGCATLETFHGLLGIIGCDAHDYVIMHKLICEQVDIPCAVTVTTQDLAAQKAHVMCVIETQLSTESCKRTAKAQVNADADAASGCAALETFHGLLGIIGCDAHDYAILNKLICEHVDIPCTLATTIAPA